MSPTPPIKTPPPRLRQRWRARAATWRIWWEPETALRELGFAPVELDAKRLTWSTREAERLNGLVEAARGGGAPAQAERKGRTVKALIARYLASPAFSGLAAATQRDYRNGLRLIEDKWGADLVVNFTPGICYAWYETLHSERGVFMAAHVMRKMSLLFAYAKKIGWIETNPCLGQGRQTPPRRQRIGTWLELEALTHAARRLGLHSMELAILMGVFTGQRRADIIRADRAAFAGQSWLLRRQKRSNAGGFEVHPELHAPIRAMLARAGDRERLLHYEGTLEHPQDMPYSDDLFSSAWDRVRDEAAKAAPSVKGLQFRDLRRTFAALARAGGADQRAVADALGNKAFTDAELSQVYMPPTYESASSAVRAVKRPKKRVTK